MRPAHALGGPPCRDRTQDGTGVPGEEPGGAGAGGAAARYRDRLPSMRVLQINTFAEPVGGAETYLFGLLGELRRRGHEVLLFGTSPDREVDQPGLRVVRRPAYDPSRLFRDEPVRRALERTLERFDPEVVHVHNLHALGLDLLGTLAAAGRPVVQTVHDFGVLCPNSWCVRGDGTPCPGGPGAQCFAHRCTDNYPYDARQVLVAMVRLRLVRALVDVALAPSHHLADLLRGQGFPDVRQLHYFVEEEEGLAGPIRQREPKNLLYLGRLVPEKGIDVLLAALPRILTEVPGTRLTIVGGGPLAGDLRRRAHELGTGDAVRFHTQVPHAEVRNFYASATAKVLPSIWSENSPLTAYECLAAGLPILGSRIGGIPDLVRDGETGLLFRPRDPADLAEKAVRLLRMPAEERAELSRRGRELARTLSRERNVGTVEAVYREVVARGPRPRNGAVLAWDEDVQAAIHELSAGLDRRDEWIGFLEGFRNPLGWLYLHARTRLRRLAIKSGLLRR